MPTSRQLKKWKQFFIWIFIDPRYIYISILGVIGSLLLALLSAESLPEQITLSGLYLNIMGLFTAILGTIRVRREFLPSISDIFVNWVQRRPLFRRPVSRTIRAGSATATAAAAAIAEGFGVRKPGPDASLEERIKILEENMENQIKRTSEINKNHSQRIELIKQDVAHIKQDVTQRENSINKEIEDIKQKLKTVTVGNINMQITGLCWIIIGLLFGTFTSQIASIAASVVF